MIADLLFVIKFVASFRYMQYKRVNNVLNIRFHQAISKSCSLVLEVVNYSFSPRCLVRGLASYELSIRLAFMCWRRLSKS